MGKKLIVQPCTKTSPDVLTPIKCGEFCKICKTEVIDFRRMTAEEVFSYIKENGLSGKKWCGRFEPQISSPLKKRTILKLLRAAVVFPFFFIFTPANGQQKSGTDTISGQVLDTVTVTDTLYATSIRGTGSFVMIDPHLKNQKKKKKKNFLKKLFFFRRKI